MKASVKDESPRDAPSHIPSAKTLLGLVRPYTLFQAVGALVVGRLVVAGSKALWENPIREVLAMLSIYLSYGAGMVSNDCTDKTIDALDPQKKNRPIASGTVSVSQGWAFVTALSVVSLVSGCCGVSRQYGLWTLSNLFLTTTYALFLQRVFLVKNLVVGWLCVSPLVGATLIGGVPLRADVVPKLWRMAGAGMAIGVAREILKDAEDIEIDRGQKSTIPLVLGINTARWVAMLLVLSTSATLMTPSYRVMFASSPPWFLCGWGAATAVSLRACFEPLKEQQKMVKKSIYVMLSGLIMGLIYQA